MKFFNLKIKKGGKILVDWFVLFLCFIIYIEVILLLLFFKFINFYLVESML